MTNDILGSVWPEWQIVRRIGIGSFGVVYEAVRLDHSIESHAAIKVISIPQNESEIDSLRSEGLSKDATRTYFQEVVKDFVSEIQLMESFKGVQNIVSVEDYKVLEKQDKIGWDIYIRMELLTPLNSYISDKKLSEDDVIKLGIDICKALELCAKRNIIHRDIKPENIFVNDFGYFKLGDFGIARKLENVTGGMSQKGTYNYMAPEIERGNQYDATVDIYSLGLVLYRFTNNNRFPFLDTDRQFLNPNERMTAIRRRMDGEPLPPPCNASEQLAKVILRACSYNPSNRYASATEMEEALWAINGTINVPPPPRNPLPPRDLLPPLGGDDSEDDSKTLPIITAIVVAVVFFVCAGALVRYMFSNNDSREDSSVESSANNEVEEDDGSDSTADRKDGVYSDFDEEQIAATIEEAETLAADKDYEDALTKIKTALVTYPKSEALQAKETEYTDALEAQAKTLENEDNRARGDTESTPTPEVTEEPELQPEDVVVSFISPPADLAKYEVLTPSEASSSSELVQQNADTNDPWKVLDGKDETSWQEGVDGDGLGEYLLFKFPEEKKVKYLSFKLGNWRDARYAEGNNRPQTLKVDIGEFGCQIEFPRAQQEYWLELSEPFPADQIRFEIVSVYKGTQWDDTCIAEIGMYGVG